MQINLISSSNKHTAKRTWGLHPHFLISILSIWLVVLGGLIIMTFMKSSAQNNLKTTQAELIKNNEIISKKVNLEQLIAHYEHKEQLIKQQDQDKVLWSKVISDLDIIFGVNGISPKDNSPRPIVTLTKLAVSEESLDHNFKITIEGIANNFDDLAKIQRNLQGFFVELEDQEKLFKYQDSKLIQGEILEDPKTLAKVLTFKLVVVIPKDVIKR